MNKQVLVVRKDLNMRKGKIAAQAAHASVGTLTKYMSKNVRGWFAFYPPKPMEEWLFDGSFFKIVVGCKDEKELLDLEKRSEEVGIINCLIQDAGHTEFHGVPTYTVLAIGPAPAEKIDKITGHLKLL